MIFASGVHVLVLGAGVSGMAVAGILREQGAAVTLSDAKTADKLEKDFSSLLAAGVFLELGRQDKALLAGKDYLIVSPGISINAPLIQSAYDLGITVMSEIEVAYRLCKAPIFAVTGTNGKTTTTSLIGEMLKTTGRKVVVGGNIGLALSQEVVDVPEDGMVVAEISSFQLEGIINFHPRIAAILNVTPDHLDRHQSMKIYQDTKERIFVNQNEQDYAVLNYDDGIVRAMAEKLSAQKIFFSRKQDLPAGVFVHKGMITIRWQEQVIEICPVTEMKIKGNHNVENVLAACAVAFFAGADPIAIARIVRSFEGVEHRIELVRTVAGVEYYNDSKATNPESSVKALEAFSTGIVLIAGGRDKNTDLKEFMELARDKVSAMILIGEAQERFYQAALEYGVANVRRAADLSDAVNIARSVARPSQVVLLSPACASYDMFANYEQRGRIFKDLVNRLY